MASLMQCLMDFFGFVCIGRLWNCIFIVILSHVFFNHVSCCRGGPRGTQMPDLLSPAFLDGKDLNIIQVFLKYNLFHCFQIKITSPSLKMLNI